MTKEHLQTVQDGIAAIDGQLADLQAGSDGNIAKGLGGVRDVLAEEGKLVAQAIRDA